MQAHPMTELSVKCLPILDQRVYKDLYEKLISLFDDSSDTLILFPTDLMEEGLGTEILCDIRCFTSLSDKEIAIQDKAVDILAAFAEEHVPNCRFVEVRTVDGYNQWIWKRMLIEHMNP